MAIVSLGQFGEEAREAVPLLLKAMNERGPHGPLREQAKNAVESIAPEGLTNGVSRVH